MSESDRASFAGYDIEFVVEISRCRAPLHRSTTHAVRHAVDVELYSSTALYSAPERSTALQLYSALHSTSSTPSLRVHSTTTIPFPSPHTTPSPSPSSSPLYSVSSSHFPSYHHHPIPSHPHHTLIQPNLLQHIPSPKSPHPISVTFFFAVYESPDLARFHSKLTGWPSGVRLPTALQVLQGLRSRFFSRSDPFMPAPWYYCGRSVRRRVTVAGIALATQGAHSVTAVSCPPDPCKKIRRFPSR